MSFYVVGSLYIIIHHIYSFKTNAITKLFEPQRENNLKSFCFLHDGNMKQIKTRSCQPS